LFHERLNFIRKLKGFTAQQMADYLSIDRSAMTRELRKMKADGLVDVNGRQVHLYPM